MFLPRDIVISQKCGFGEFPTDLGNAKQEGIFLYAKKELQGKVSETCVGEV